MNILKNKQNRSGIISLILLLLSFVINLINAFAFAFGGYSVILGLSESLSRILAFVFAVIGIVKALKNKRGWILCVPGIVFPLISFCFFLVALNKSQPAYTDNYVYDREKNKMEYRLGDGFFDYAAMTFIPRKVLQALTEISFMMCIWAELVKMISFPIATGLLLKMACI